MNGKQTPGMNPMMMQQQLQQKAQKMIAQEFDLQTVPKDMLGESFDEFKKAVLMLATPLSMQCEIGQFLERKKRIREKTIHHAYTLAEVGSVCNSFENSANEINTGGEDNWNALAVVCLPLAKYVQLQMQKISEDVSDRLQKGFISEGGLVNQQGHPLAGTKTAQA